MKPRRTYQVSEVARIAGISVRTLHHYDAIGLLVPASRTAAGYRLYDHADLLRLQQILINREFGLPLEAIRRALDDPSFDIKEALLQQREQLLHRACTTAEIIRAIDKTLEVISRQETDEVIDMKEIFDGFDPLKFEAEAKERWGHTDAYKESVNRGKSYTVEDWKMFREEQRAIYRDAADAMRAGNKSDNDAVMDIADRHRLSFDRWFYPCSFATHRGLADMYEADARFAEGIDKYGAELTPFLAEAIRANARRNGC